MKSAEAGTSVGIWRVGIRHYRFIETFEAGDEVESWRAGIQHRFIEPAEAGDDFWSCSRVGIHNGL